MAVNSNSITAICVSMGTNNGTISTQQPTYKPELNLIFTTSIADTNVVVSQWIADDQNAMTRPVIFNSNYSLGCAMASASSLTQTEPMLLDITSSSEEVSFHMTVLITDMVPRMREYFSGGYLSQYVNGQITNYEQLLTIWQFIHFVSFNPNNNFEQIVQQHDCISVVSNMQGIHTQSINGDIEYYTWYSPMFMASQTMNQDLFVRTFVQTPACHMFITEDMYIALAMCAMQSLDKTNSDMYTPDANPHFKPVFTQIGLLGDIIDIWVAMFIKDFLSDFALARLHAASFLD